MPDGHFQLTATALAAVTAHVQVSTLWSFFSYVGTVNMAACVRNAFVMHVLVLLACRYGIDVRHIWGMTEVRHMQLAAAEQS